jgi:hypothetical protein
MNDWLSFEKRILGTKHKYINFQIGWNRESTNIFYFNLQWSYKVDHAGFSINFDLGKFYLILETYDNRHWCNKCNSFKNETCYLEKHDD